MHKGDLWNIKKILIGSPTLFDDDDLDKNKGRILLYTFMRLYRRRRATSFLLTEKKQKVKTVCSLFKPPRFAMEAPFDVSPPQSLPKD